MRKLILVVCCIGLLSGCAATKGKIEGQGFILISGYEFSDCNKATAAIEIKGDSIYLCGYSLTELGNITFDSLSFDGEPTEDEAETR